MITNNEYVLKKLYEDLKDIARQYNINVKTATAIDSMADASRWLCPDFSEKSMTAIRPTGCVHKIEPLYDGIRWPENIIWPSNKEMNINKGREKMRTNTMNLFWSTADYNRVFGTAMTYTEEKEENTNWEFHSASDADINWKDIKDTLSYKEPLALVTRKFKGYEGAYKYVVINKQLWDKALAIGNGIEDIPSIIPDGIVTKRVFRIDNSFSEWVEWAKAVKAAKWPDGEKSTLNVILPTV